MGRDEPRLDVGARVLVEGQVAAAVVRGHDAGRLGHGSRASA
ncbi:hypothetical protein [Rothia santali]|nr:hypothetical protein [Rothia santali]